MESGNQSEVLLLKLSLEAETSQKSWNQTCTISPLLQISFPGLYLIEQASLDYVSHHSELRLGRGAPVSLPATFGCFEPIFYLGPSQASPPPPHSSSFFSSSFPLSLLFIIHRSLVSRLLSPSCLKPFPNISGVSVASCDWCACDYSFWQTCSCAGKNLRYLQKTAACEEVYGQCEERRTCFILCFFYFISEPHSASRGQVFGRLSPPPSSPRPLWHLVH